MTSSETIKPKKGLKEWVEGQYISNLIKVIVNSVIFLLLIYWLEGSALNDEEVFVISFLIVFITMYIPIVVNDVITDSRLAFLQGKWELRSDDEPPKLGKIIPYWRRFGPEAAILGSIAALLAGLLFYAIYLVNGTPPPFIGPMLSIVVSFAVTLVISSVILKRHLSSDLASFAVALSSSDQAPSDPVKHYFFWEHIFPWSILLGVLVFEVNFKGFVETALKNANVVPGSSVLFSIWITALVLLYWMFSSAQNQVLPDVHLGRVAQGQQISRVTIIILILTIPVVMSGIFYVIELIAGRFDFSVEESLITIVIVAILAGIIGRWLGIARGKTKEFPKIKSA